MSRSSRRKTLSHSEIENFLSELSLPKQVDESIPETSPISVDEPFISCTELISTQIAAQAEADEVVWIRELCKLKFSSPAVQSMSHLKRIEIGRCILQSSNYRILPTRMLRPDLFDHPASSLEGKKKLLLSLSPMLTDNEAQRKADVTACEEFTRCKSGKGKGRLANYEYVDMDTNTVIDHAEFEQRYLNFIVANKPKSYDLSGVSRSSPPMDPNVMLTNKIPDLLEVYNLETPSVYVKEVSIKKKSELIQFDTVGKENVINSSSSFSASRSSNVGLSSSSNSSNILPTETEALAKPSIASSSGFSGSSSVSSQPLNSLLPRKTKENDRKRKNNTFGSERRVTLSPATARAMMLKAFEEDEPTVFPACPVFDYDLGSNSMVSPSRLLIKEFKSPDVFSNPNFIDSEEADEVAPAAPCPLAVKLFIDELPLETPSVAPVTGASAESAAPIVVINVDEAPAEVLMDVEKAEDVMEIVPAPSSASKAPKDVVVIDLTDESSNIKPQAAVADAATKTVSTPSSSLQQELDNFSRELDGILANDEDTFASSPRATEAVFKFPSAVDHQTEVQSPEAASADSALDSLDTLLSTDDDAEDDILDVTGGDAPSLEFLASMASAQTVQLPTEEILSSISSEVAEVDELVEVEVVSDEKKVEDTVVDEVAEEERPASTVQMSEDKEEEQDDLELVHVLSSTSDDATTVASESTISSAATIEVARSTSSCGGMLLDREATKSVLQEAYSRLNEGASELETFQMIETLIGKAEEGSCSGGDAVTVVAPTPSVVIDSALYAFCNDAPINVPESMQSASTDIDDDEEYPYFKPLDRKTVATSSASSSEAQTTSSGVVVVDLTDDVVMDHSDNLVTDQAESVQVSASQSTPPLPQFEDVYGEPLDYGMAQEKAYKQRLVRFEVARWKYQWELVSVKAANEAIARAKSRYDV